MHAYSEAAHEDSVVDDTCTEIEPNALFADGLSDFFLSDPFAATDATLAVEYLNAQEQHHDATALSATSLQEYYALAGHLNLFQDYHNPKAADCLNACGQQSNVFLGLPMEEESKNEAMLNNTGMDRCDRSNMDISSHRFHNGRVFMVNEEYKQRKQDFTKITWSKSYAARDNVNNETGLLMPDNPFLKKPRNVLNVGGVGLSFAEIKHQLVVTGRLKGGPAALKRVPNSNEPLIKDGDILKEVDFCPVNGFMNFFALHNRLVGLVDSMVYLKFGRIEHGVGFEIKYGPLVLDDKCDHDNQTKLHEGEWWDTTLLNTEHVYYVTRNICFNEQNKDYRVEFGEILDAINGTKCSLLNPNEVQNMLHGPVNTYVKIDLWDRLVTTKRSMTIQRLCNHTMTRTYNVVLKRQKYDGIGKHIYHCADCVRKMRLWRDRPTHKKEFLVANSKKMYFSKHPHSQSMSSAMA